MKDNKLFKRGRKELKDGDVTPGTKKNGLGNSVNGLYIKDNTTERFIPLGDQEVTQTSEGVICYEVDAGNGERVRLPALADPAITEDGGDEYLMIKTTTGTKRILITPV